MTNTKPSGVFLDNDEFFFDSLELENEWKKSLPRFTDRELLEVFPISKEDLRETIIVQQKRYDSLATEIKTWLLLVPKEAEWFFDIVFDKLMIPDLKRIERSILRLKRQLAMISPSTDKSPRGWKSFDDLIATAKARPIAELARDKLELRPSGKNFVALCPFHNEKTPSCYFYTQTNTFYCFGCGEKGDVITFIMRLYGIGFTDAVKMLK